MNGDILLTGATGLIGGEIAWRLMKSGRRVWCLVRSRSFADAAARLERRFALSGAQCDWSRLVALPGDVTQDMLGLQPDTLQHLRTQCSQVIHCAAETSFAADNRCEQVNVIGARNVLQLCSVLGPQLRLFFMSSAVVSTEPARSSQHEEAPNSIRHPASGIRHPAVIPESQPYAGYANDYVLSKRHCEELVLQSPVDAVVLRPSIVLSHGVNGRDFAKSVLWVLPVMRRLGVLPLTGDEPVDAVSVRFVAEAVARLVQRPLPHRIYHLSTGPEAIVTLRELFAALTRAGHDYSRVHLDPTLNWETFGPSNPRLRRLKEMVNCYLPFLRTAAVYDARRLEATLGEDMPPCPPLTDYCAELLYQFSESEAFAEALSP